MKHIFYVELKRNMTEDLVIVVVANKLDLAQVRREVSYDDAQQYITRVLGPDTLLYEVSAKEDNGNKRNHVIFDSSVIDSSFLCRFNRRNFCSHCSCTR